MRFLIALLLLSPVVHAQVVPAETEARVRHEIATSQATFAVQLRRMESVLVARGFTKTETSLTITPFDRYSGDSCGHHNNERCMVTSYVYEIKFARAGEVRILSGVGYLRVSAATQRFLTIRPDSVNLE